MNLAENIAEGKSLYKSKNYKEAIAFLEETCLSDSACAQNRSLLSELHLLLAKCYRGLKDLKNAILSCNSAIEAYPAWKDPFIYRSSSFQALETLFLETDGDSPENISYDRQNADIVVGGDGGSSQIHVDTIQEALKLAKNGSRIFVEAGTYEVSSSSSEASPAFFLFEKNVSIIGASTRDCVLIYKNANRGSRRGLPLDIFLICSSKDGHSLIKRLTFRNLSSSESVDAKFIGVGAGRVQFEDCLFDGVEYSRIDAIYSSSKICGVLAERYPPPFVIVRFCVFNRCESFSAITAIRGGGSIQNCYFIGCGSSGVAALDSAKITVENCEFAQNIQDRQIIKGSNSDVTVKGCYFQGLNVTTDAWTRDAYAVHVSVKSVAKITQNYLYKIGNGICADDSELLCSENLIFNCSKKCISSDLSSTLGLFAAVCVKQKSKCLILNNSFNRCDVGLYVGQAASPIVKDNKISGSIFAGLFIECHSKPNVVGNVFFGSEGPQIKCGLGVLYFVESAGLLGKNQFKFYDVSPIMTFSTCHPLIKDNSFDHVNVDEEKQRTIEAKMLQHFQEDIFRKDQYFYVIDSEQKEDEVREVILKGPPTT